jgi:hypothetical protein
VIARDGSTFRYFTTVGHGGSTEGCRKEGPKASGGRRTSIGPASSKLFGRLVGPENSVDLCGESDDVRTLLTYALHGTNKRDGSTFRCFTTEGHGGNTEGCRREGPKASGRPMTLMGPASSKLIGRMVGPENSVDLCGSLR